MTFFDQNSSSFHQAQVTEKGVETLPFLQGCQVLVSLLESLGSAFSPVRNDIQGNITKIKTKYDSDPANSQTLEGIVLKEGKKGVATDALLWLKRGLEFTTLALRNNIDSTEELSVSFSKAYKETLSKHHSFLIRPIFSVAMSACPSRQNFYESLAKDPKDVPKVQEQMNEWVKGLESRLSTIVAFYKKEGLDK